MKNDRIIFSETRNMSNNIIRFLVNSGNFEIGVDQYCIKVLAIISLSELWC